MYLKEIFEYAIDQEIKAREIYGRSAAQTDNVETSALFRSLARMEWVAAGLSRPKSACCPRLASWSGTRKRRPRNWSSVR